MADRYKERLNMAMEQLLKIAERTEAMPDEMLAQVAAQGEGMGSLLAAT